MRIESDMNDADIQKFFNAYIRTANPTAVCNRLIRALEAQLEGKNINTTDPEVRLLHSFYLTMSQAHDDMSYMEEKLLGIPSDVPPIPLL